jgi:hypothetical protein
LQLPEAALVAVLQQLDPCSLANTALACTALSHAVPGSMKTITACFKSPEMLDSFTFWLDQNETRLDHISQCDVESDMRDYGAPDSFPADQAVLQHLPCPGLRLLRLQGQKLQLQPTAGWRGVLGVCTALTHWNWSAA